MSLNYVQVSPDCDKDLINDRPIMIATINTKYTDYYRQSYTKVIYIKNRDK